MTKSFRPAQNAKMATGSECSNHMQVVYKRRSRVIVAALLILSACAANRQPLPQNPRLLDYYYYYTSTGYAPIDVPLGVVLTPITICAFAGAYAFEHPTDFVNTLSG